MIAVLFGLIGSILGWADRKGTSDCADEVTLSLKGAKSRTGGRKAPSTKTKGRARRAGQLQESRAELYQQLEACRRALAEAREQQTATSEVLGVISSSPGELEPVFQAMLENATRICEAKFGNLLLYDGASFQVAAIHGAVPAFEELRRRNPTFQVSGEGPLTRLVATKQPQHVIDTKLEAAYAERDAGLVPLVDVAGARTFLAVPMLKESKLLGVFSIYRQEVRPFTAKQIELIQNFASQAVIAIENARLLNELRQRTSDLGEALEQQTATSEVLAVISSSPGELEPAFQAMLENATRICEAAFGTILLREGDGFRRVALHNAPRAYVEYSKSAPLLGRTKTLTHLLETMQAAQVADMAVVEPESPITRFGGARTLLNVPLIKEDELIGVINIYRQEVRPFTDKQIELVKNFAAQAVIAIENARLLKELRQRTERSERVAGATDGDLRSVARHFELARRA